MPPRADDGVTRRPELRRWSMVVALAILVGGAVAVWPVAARLGGGGGSAARSPLSRPASPSAVQTGAPPETPATPGPATGAAPPAAIRPSLRAPATRPPLPPAPMLADTAPWSVRGLKVVSYFPANAPFAMMWKAWNDVTRSALDGDMARIRQLNANTVRVFVMPAAFGYPAVDPTQIAHLRTLVDTAATHGLRVWLNLFDTGFTAWTDLAGSDAWASSVLSPFVADPRIAVVEVRNEVDWNDAQQVAWARHMIPSVRAMAHGIPVSVSVGTEDPHWLGYLRGALGGSQPDVYGFHPYFSDVAQAPRVFGQLTAVTAPVPTLVGETGFSTVPPGTEAQQADYWSAIDVAAERAGLEPPAVWMLNDFQPGGDFGMYRKDGRVKPAAAVVSRMFARR